MSYFANLPGLDVDGSRAVEERRTGLTTDLRRLTSDFRLCSVSELDFREKSQRVLRLLAGLLLLSLSALLVVLSFLRFLLSLFSFLEGVLRLLQFPAESIDLFLSMYWQVVFLLFPLLLYPGPQGFCFWFIIHFGTMM